LFDDGSEWILQTAFEPKDIDSVRSMISHVVTPYQLWPWEFKSYVLSAFRQIPICKPGNFNSRWRWIDIFAFPEAPLLDLIPSVDDGYELNRSHPVQQPVAPIVGDRTENSMDDIDESIQLVEQTPKLGLPKETD
jgi:hypothetical protein